MMVGGEKVHSAARQELVSIRGIVAGEYTVNVYHFTARDASVVPVTVIIDKLNPRVTAVRRTLDLSGARVERPAGFEPPLRLYRAASGLLSGQSRWMMVQIPDR
jgi:hypothetical protein